MIRLLLYLMFSLTGTICSAEEVQVFSGEHEDFSRIVLRFQDPVEWKQDGDSKYVEIEFSRNDIEVDTSRVFEKMPRIRFLGVGFDTAGSTLILETASDIVLEVFLVDELTLVIDGREAPDDTVTTTPNAILPPEDPFPFGRPNPPGLGSKIPAAIAVQPSRVSQGRPLGGSSREYKLDETYRTLREAVEGSEGIWTDSAERRAVTQKAASPDIRHRDAKLESQHLEVLPPWADRSSGDSDQSASTENKNGCLGEDRVDISKWYKEGSAASVIAQARLFSEGEMDQVSGVDVERVVRAYIFLGFGVEEVAILNEYGSSVIDRELYLEIAYILEGWNLPGRSIFQGLGFCGGPSSLWAFLVEDENRYSQEFNYNSIQASLIGLPVHIRSLIGPRVAEKLLERGERVRFEAVHAALGRDGEGKTNGWWLLEGRKLVQSGDYVEGVDILKESLTRANEQPVAFMREILQANRVSGAINVDDLELAEVVYIEDKLNDQNGELLEELALGWFSMENFDVAWKYWDQVKLFPISQHVRERDFSSIVEELIEKDMDSQIYLLKYNSDRSHFLEMLSDDAVIKLAGWAAENEEVGWADELVAGRGLKDSVALRELLVRIALAKKDHDLALALTSGLSEERADEQEARNYKGFLGPHNATELSEVGSFKDVNHTGPEGVIYREESQDIGASAERRAEAGEPMKDDTNFSFGGAVSMDEAREIVFQSEAILRELEVVLQSLN